MRTLAGSVIVAGLAGLGGSLGPAGAAEIAIGGGEPGSAYYQLSRAICRLVDSGREDHGLTCEPLATPGGLFNLANVRGGAIEFGLVPSDLHYHAVEQSGPFQFADARFENIRSLFSLQSELFTLISRRGAGIAGLDDLEGRRINIGTWGTAERGGIDAVFAVKDWSADNFLFTDEMSARQQSLAFCHERLDTIVYSVAHPDKDVARVLALCDGALVGLSAGDMTRLLARHPYYVAGEISAQSYVESPEAISTFGIKVTLVSSTEVDEESVYAVVKAVFENLDRLKRSNRLLKGLHPGEMMRDGLTAPLHEGARRYFEEAGMM